MRHGRALHTLHGLAAAVIVGLCPAASPAQSLSPDCNGDGCRLTEQLAETSRQIQAGKAEFAGALRLFLISTAGTYGDESPILRRQLAAASAALGRWDAAIRAYGALLGPIAGNADVHVALGSVHLDRGDLRRALDELSVAGRLAPWRADTFLLQGLAHEAASRLPEALAAFERAATLAPTNLTALYAVARLNMRLGGETQAVEALERFSRAQDSRVRERRTPLSFPRVALFREAGNTLPMLVPASYVPGLDLLARGRYEDALALFRRSLDRDSLAGAAGPLPAAVAAGAAALRSGAIREAIGHFEIAVGADPHSSEAQRLLGTALLADDRREQAIERLERAAGPIGGDERSRLALADALVAAGQTDRAERVLRECLDALPASVQARFALGRLLQTADRGQEALVHFSAVADRRPPVGLDYLFDQIGSLQLSLGNVDGAVSAFERRVDGNPGSADAHRRLGLAYLQQARPVEALAEFTAAILLDPASVDAHTGRAQILLQRGEWAAAEAAAREALDRDPEHMAARYARGAALVRLGRTEEGVREIAAFERMQAEARARDERRWALAQLKQAAWTCADNGDLDCAVELLTRALALERDDAALHVSLGAVLRRAGRHDEAAQAFELALTHGAGLEVHAHLAEAYEALGRLDDSRRHRQLADEARADRIRRAGAVP